MKKALTQYQLVKYRERVNKVLLEQGFIINNNEKKIISERISNGRRYFYMVAKRQEGEKIIERFVKVPENDQKKLLLPFQRQIEFAKYVKSRDVFMTRGVVAHNYNPKKGIPFVIMETFPVSGSKIGFIEGDKGLELLAAREAKNTVNQLEKMHAIPVNSLPLKLRKVLRHYDGDYESFKRQILFYTNKKVNALDGKKGKSESFYRVLERRLDIFNFKGKVLEMLNVLKPVIDDKENRINCLVHGDMSPNNLYVFNSGDVELLDLEWVGFFRNKAIAMIFDFGNLRARSWVNGGFKKALDAALIKSYKKQGKEALGRAIVALSILRSHIQLSGYFENYDEVKQGNFIQARRRRLTEQDIKEALKVIKDFLI